MQGLRTLLENADNLKREPVGIVLPVSAKSMVIEVFGGVPDCIKFAEELMPNQVGLKFKDVFVDEYQRIEMKQKPLISNPFIQCPSQGYGRARR